MNLNKYFIKRIVISIIFVSSSLQFSEAIAKNEIILSNSLSSITFLKDTEEFVNIQIGDYKTTKEDVKKDIESWLVYLKPKIKDSYIDCKDEICNLVVKRESLFSLLNTNQTIELYKYGEFVNSIEINIVYNHQLALYSSYNYKDWIFDISSLFPYKRIQEKSLSCESSATADILSSLSWKNYNEDFVINLLDKDFYNQKPTSYNWKRVWGNPNKWFVGYIDRLSSWKKAQQFNYTGYWVLESPIAKVFKSIWYNTKIINDTMYNSSYKEKEHLKELFIELINWNRVQLWGDYCTNPKEDNWTKNYCNLWEKDRKLSWRYKDGENYKEYVWLSGEHAFYLLWFEWNIESPSKIIVWDTYTWKHSYSLKEWKRKWNLMQNRSVIIYKK